MINMIIDILPMSVTIGGAEYEINSSFRTSILFELLIQDDSLEKDEKIIQTLELYYYPQKIPNEHIEEAIDKAIWFYSCDRKAKQSKGKGTNQKKQIYSFDDDAEYIFSAFLDQYNVDLQEQDELHWWKFKAMFKALKEDNELCKIMKFRATDLTKIKDKEEKAYYKKMQELYKIEEKISSEDIEELEKWDDVFK